MATKRRPATAEEVQDFFESATVEVAELMYRLVGSKLKKRMVHEAKPERLARPAKAAAVAPTVAP